MSRLQKPQVLGITALSLIRSHEWTSFDDLEADCEPPLLPLRQIRIGPMDLWLPYNEGIPRIQGHLRHNGTLALQCSAQLSRVPDGMACPKAVWRFLPR